MNRKKGKMLLVALIAILLLGVGYAAISSVGLTINGLSSAKANGTNEDFKVRFVKAEAADDEYVANASENAILKSGELANGDPMDLSKLAAGVTNDTTATFTASELTTVGDFAEFTYYVVNESEELDAELSFDISNNNSQKEYFRITKSVDDTALQSGDVTQVKVKVELIKRPLLNDVTGSFTITLIANPKEQGTATSIDGGIVVSEQEITTASDLISALNDTTTETKILNIKSDLDLTNEQQITISKDTTLDFDGNKVQVAANALTVEDGAKLVLEDVTGNGGLVADRNVVTVLSDSELVIKSGTYETNEWNQRGAVVTIPEETENAKVTIDGGTFNGEYFALSSLGNADVVINGGEFNSTATVKHTIEGDVDEKGKLKTYHAYSVKIANGTFTMNGGKISGVHGGLALTGTAAATINDGEIYVANSYEGANDSYYDFYLEGNASVKVLNGTFTNDGSNPLVYTTTTGYADLYDGTFTAKSAKAFNGDPVNVRVYGGTYLKKTNDTTANYDASKIDPYRQS